MKSFLVRPGWVCLYLLLIALQTVLVTPNARAEEVKKASIAVLDFRIGSALTASGQKVDIETGALTEKFITALVNTHKFEVVERQRLTALMDEMKLAESGLIAPEHLPRMKQLCGADYYVLGSISTARFSVAHERVPYVDNSYTRIVSGQIIADVRLVETETGRIVCARDEDVQRAAREVVNTTSVSRAPAGFVDDVERALVNKFVEHIVDSCYPAKIIRFAEGVAYLNRGKNFGIQSGDRFQAYRLGEPLTDTDTNEVLGAEEQELAVLEVTESQEKTAKARVVKWQSDQPAQGAADAPGQDLMAAICRKAEKPKPAVAKPAAPEKKKHLPQW